MKNKKFKFFVPVSVFMFAVAAAFAFNTPQNENVVAKPGYIFKNNVCEQEGQCADIGSVICTHDEMQVFRLTGNSCIKVLRGPWQQ